MPSELEDFRENSFKMPIRLHNIYILGITIYITKMNKECSFVKKNQTSTRMIKLFSELIVKQYNYTCEFIVHKMYAICVMFSTILLNTVYNCFNHIALKTAPKHSSAT